MKRYVAFNTAFWLGIAFLVFFALFGLISLTTGTPFQWGMAIGLSIAIGGGIAFTAIRSAKNDTDR